MELAIGFLKRLPRLIFPEERHTGPGGVSLPGPAVGRPRSGHGRDFGLWHADACCALLTLKFDFG